MWLASCILVFLAIGNASCSAVYRMEKGTIYDAYVQSASISVDMEDDLYVVPSPDPCPVVKGPSQQQLNLNYVTLKSAIIGLKRNGTIPVDNQAAMVAAVNALPAGDPLQLLLGVTLFPRILTCQDACDYTTPGVTCGQPTDRLHFVNQDPFWAPYVQYDMSTEPCVCAHPEWCNTSTYEWIPLNIGTTTITQTSDSQIYRFYADSFDGYMITYVPEIGANINMELQPYAFPPQFVSGWGHHEAEDILTRFLGLPAPEQYTPLYQTFVVGGGAAIHACPTDHNIFVDKFNKYNRNQLFGNTSLWYPRTHYPFGTQFLATSCYLWNTCKFNLTITKRLPTAYVENATLVDRCSNTTVPAGHRCLQDGAIYYEHWVGKPASVTATAARAATVVRHAFLPDPNVCKNGNPFLLEISLVTTNRENYYLAFSFSGPPDINVPSSFYYSDLGASSLGTSHFFSIPCDGTVQTDLVYVGLFPAFIFEPWDRQVEYRLSVKSVWGTRPPLVPSLSLPPIHFYQTTTSSIELHCDGVRVRPCTSRVGLNLIKTLPLWCDRYLQVVYPTEEEASKFFPPLMKGSDVETRFWDRFPIENYTALPKTLQATYILYSKSDFEEVNNINETTFSTCKIFFSGQLLDSNYLPASPAGIAKIGDSYPLQEEALSCDYNQLTNATQAVQDGVTQLAQTSGATLGEVSLDLYLTSVVLFHPAIQRCLRYMESTSSKQPVTIVVTSDSCTNQTNTTNPCCSADSKYFQCCEASLQEKTEEVWSSGLDSCADDVCATELLQSLSSAIIPDRCPPQGNYKFEIDQQIQFWIDCVVAVFGVEDFRYVGRCFADSDCVAGYTCDPLLWLCIGNSTYGYDDLFLKCFIGNISLSILSRLVPPGSGVDVADESQVENFLRNNYFSSQCAHTNRFDIQFMNNFRRDMSCQTVTCGSHLNSGTNIYEWIRYLPPSLVTSGCTESVFCGGEVRLYKQRTTTEQDCALMQSCNLVSAQVNFCVGNYVSHLPGLGARECAYSTCNPAAVGRCVFCPVADVCFDVPYATQANCSSVGYVCVKPGHLQSEVPTILGFSATPEGCQIPAYLNNTNCFMGSYFWSSVGVFQRENVPYGQYKHCNDPGSCSTKDTCEANGACESWNWYNKLAVTTLAGGVCWLDKSPYTDVGTLVCGPLTPPGSVASIGGVVATWDTTHLGCAAYSVNSTSCPNVVTYTGVPLTGRFVPYALNESSCLNSHLSCPAYVQDKTAASLRVWMSKDSPSCSPCSEGESLQSPFKWLQHRWVPNGAYMAQWAEPKQYAFATWRESLDYTALGNAVRDIVINDYLYQSRSGLNCRVQQPLSLLNAIACNCLSGVKQKQEEDLAQGVNNNLEYYCPAASVFPASTGLLCYAQPLEILIFPHTVLFNSTSYRVGGTCVEIEIFETQITLYHDEFFPGVESSFTLQELRHDYSPVVDTLLCRNEGFAVIGSLLTGGFQFTWTGDTIYDFTLCLQNQGRARDDLYPKLDFGRLIDGHVIPMGLTLEEDPFRGSCGTIPSMQSNDTFFLVQTIENFPDYRQIYIRLSAVILVSIFSVLYFVVGIACLVMTWLQWDRSILRYLLLLCGAHAIWRTVHLLVLVITWGTVTSPVLSEPPNFIFISCMVEMVVLYVTCLHATDKKKSSKEALGLRVLGSSLYLFLLAVLLLAYLLPKGNLHYFSCYNAVDEGTEPWPNQKILNVAYIVTLGLICLILALILLFLAQHVEQMRKEGAAANEDTSRASTIFIIALLFAITFICHIAFLIGFNVGALHNVEVRICILFLFEELAPVVTLIFFARQVVSSGSSSATSRTVR